MPNQEESNKSFDLVSMKSLIFHGVKSVVFTKLDMSTSYKRAKIAYKIDTGSEGTLNPFKVFRIIFPWSPLAEFSVTITGQQCLKHIIR